MACVPEKKDPVELQCGSSFVEVTACDYDESNIDSGKRWLLKGHLETQQQRSLGPVPESLLPGLLTHVSLLDVLCAKVTETL